MIPGIEIRPCAQLLLVTFFRETQSLSRLVLDVDLNLDLDVVSLLGVTFRE